jgi:hypothetical protein
MNIAVVTIAGASIGLGVRLEHLENPITIFLPDGSQGRVWLGWIGLSV